MREWSEEEIVTYMKRVNKFLTSGMKVSDAEDLAEQMTERDFSKDDDRRVCFECRKLNKDLTCPAMLDNRKKPLPAPWQVLRRCDYFELKGNK
jgi:hypothetical protein